MSEPLGGRVPTELWQHILHLALLLEFDEADIPLSRTWRRRRLQYRIKSGYHALWDVRARLRIVNRYWNALVDKLPSTWVQIRTSETPSLTFKTISSFVGNVPLPATVIPLLRRHTIQTLSLKCTPGPATYIFLEIARNAHTLPYLQALHVALRGYPSKDASDSMVALIAAFAQHLVTLRVTVFTLNVETPPRLWLPKLRYLQVDCETEKTYVNLGVPRWSLPSIRWLELPSFVRHHLFPAAAKPDWAADLQTLGLRWLPPPDTETLWSCFSALRTIRVGYPIWQDSFYLGPDSPVRELVLRGSLMRLNTFLPVFEKFVRVAGRSGEVSQPDHNSSCTGPETVNRRKIILEGMDWANPWPLREYIVELSAQWERIAPFLEDECGVSWLKAKTCFPHLSKRVLGAS